MSDTGIRLYSTLSKRKEPLVPDEGGHVRIYACGPTVYSRIHIGNARPFVVFSVLKRHLERRGLRTTLVCNITDINDKIYVTAAREGLPSEEVARKYADLYIADTDRLGLGRPTFEPRVTDTLPEIIALIEDLENKGLAYAAYGSVYFRVAAFPAYGCLSGRKLDDMRSDDEPGPGKESPHDFALWKAHKEGEDTSWDSPWGPGRPGWHIECSAMAEATVGMEFEIHGGGLDLAFPHHENEIAQSEGARGRPFAKIWMHNEMLELSGEKMAKSVGNIASLTEVLDQWPRDTIIAYFLTSHYRSKLPFSPDRLEESAKRVERLRNTLRTIGAAIDAPGEGTDQELAAALIDGQQRFLAALDDDFNTPEAWAALDGVARAINQSIDSPSRPSANQLREAKRALLDLLDVFALANIDADDAVPAEVAQMVQDREAARAARDFAEADRLRDAVRALGYEIRDSADGPQAVPVG